MFIGISWAAIFEVYLIFLATIPSSEGREKLEIVSSSVLSITGCPGLKSSTFLVPNSLCHYNTKTVRRIHVSW